MADETLKLEGVHLIFRNFAGKKGKFNQEGRRGFAILLDEPTAEAMTSYGWNVKWLKPRDDSEEEEQPQPFLEVKIRYDVGRPPKVVMLTSRGPTILDEGNIEMLDMVDIENADVILRPWEWGPINGKSGIAVYLKSLWVTIEEDELDLKYSDVFTSQIPQ